MDIKVSLPKPSDTSGNKIKSFLRQMELSIHHLQKSIEEMEKEAPLTENTYIMFRFPFLERQYSKDKDIAEVHVDDSADQMQEIDMEINTI